MRKIILIIFASFSFGFIFFAKSAKASEGIVELRSTNNSDYRCYATSMLMGNNRYKLLVGCRDLTYPGGTQILYYTIWTNPTDGGKAVKLGTLDLGKKEFETKDEFASVFVTTESSTKVNSPSGPTVMQGKVQPIYFLEQSQSPTPTPEGFESPDSEAETQTPAQPQSTREKLITALRRAGVAALFALVGIIGLIFVITRSRG